MVRIFKNIGIGLFADGDSPMFLLAPMLSMFDVRCVHRPNFTNPKTKGSWNNT